MASTRRSLLIGAGVLGAAATVPVVQHVRWGGKDFARGDYEAGLPEPPEGEESWANWAGNERATPKNMVWPETEEELADVMRQTTGRIRPVGSGHSFSGVAPSEGTMVHLGGIEGLRSLDPVTGEATFGAGTLLFNAAQELDAQGRAFDNLSDIDVQTLAGAFATGTHGTGENLTALHDYITGFRMVTADGDILDVNATSNPDLFAAGKVSLGALGIITEYRLRTVPAFKLERTVRVEPRDEFIEKITDLASNHRHFEFFYFPGTGLVASIVHDVTDAPVSDHTEADDDEVLQGLRQLRDEFGWAPWLRRWIAQSQFPHGVIENRVDHSSALLATARPTQFVEMEYHLPLEEGPAMVEHVMTMLDQRSSVYFPMEYRHVATDDAWLSPFSGGPRASIAIHASPEEHYDFFFTEFEPEYVAKGGRPHWGKLHSLDASNFRGLYPDFERFLDLRKELDPSGKFLNPHLAKLFGEAFDV